MGRLWRLVSITSITLMRTNRKCKQELDMRGYDMTWLFYPVLTYTRGPHDTNKIIQEPFLISYNVIPLSLSVQKSVTLPL